MTYWSVAFCWKMAPCIWNSNVLLLLMTTIWFGFFAPRLKSPWTGFTYSEFRRRWLPEAAIGALWTSRAFDDYGLFSELLSTGPMSPVAFAIGPVLIFAGIGFPG
jgi:hypothetical protein